MSPVRFLPDLLVLGGLVVASIGVGVVAGVGVAMIAAGGGIFLVGVLFGRAGL